jgi:hypothetical protein
VPSKREAKRRAVLELLDRIPVRAADAAHVQKQAGKTTPPMEIAVPAKAPQRQPLQGK